MLTHFIGFVMLRTILAHGEITPTVQYSEKLSPPRYNIVQADSDSTKLMPVWTRAFQGIALSEQQRTRVLAIQDSVQHYIAKTAPRLRADSAGISGEDRVMKMLRDGLRHEVALMRSILDEDQQKQFDQHIAEMRLLDPTAESHVTTHPPTQ